MRNITGKREKRQWSLSAIGSQPQAIDGAGSKTENRWSRSWDENSGHYASPHFSILDPQSST
jgi:hypothetical protein